MNPGAFVSRWLSKNALSIRCLTPSWRNVLSLFNERPTAFWISCGVLTLVKIWLVGGLTLFAVGLSGHDERLFLNHAASLLDGHWMGPYNNLTLLKGPFYPFWIATVFVLGLPLLLAQHFLYAVACVVFVIALRPLLSRGKLLLVFSILLFNPAEYSGGSGVCRVIRDGIYPSLTLLVLAGAVGFLARYDYPVKKLARWAVLLGLSLAAFWLTREEGAWLSVSLLVIAATAGVKIWRARPKDRVSRLSLFALAFGLWLLALGTVASINKAEYGVFVTAEVKEPNFLNAYGALLRVKHAHWRRDVPVPTEARLRVYQVSPAFAELEPFLEGDIGKGWTAASRSDEMRGGWFWIALRDAVAAAGYYSSNATTAAAYYQRLASEVNAACAEGKLECGRQRASMMPPWHKEYNRLLLKTLPRATVYLTHFKDCETTVPPSRGPEESLVLFQDLTRERLSPTAAAPPSPLVFQAYLNHFKIGILNHIGHAYQRIIPVLAWLAVVAYAVRIGQLFLQKRITSLWVTNTALFIAVGARLAMISVIDVTSFEAILVCYLVSAYPLLLAFISLSLLDFPSLMRHARPSASV